MIYSTTYNPIYDGIRAYRHNDSCLSSGLSFEPESAPTFVFEDAQIALMNRFRFTFSLLLSMATISSGLSISLKKRKMKAKFNREAYAKSIQVSEGENKQGADSLQTHKFQVADYSFHIKETSGKVLSCSEVWYK